MTNTAETRNRSTVAVGVAVTLLLVVAVGVAARRPATPSATEVASSAAEKPGSAASAEASGAPSSDTTVSALPPGVKPGTGGATAPGTPGAIAASPAAPKKPAAAGSHLTTLAAPPLKTIGMISVPESFVSGAYDVSFEPFGWGPRGPAGGRLVAHIVSSAPTDDGAKALGKEFADRNVTLWCSDSVADAITLGGTYSGRVQVRKKGDIGVFYLVEVKRAN